MEEPHRAARWDSIRKAWKIRHRVFFHSHRAHMGQIGLRYTDCRLTSCLRIGGGFESGSRGKLWNWGKKKSEPGERRQSGEVVLNRGYHGIGLSTLNRDEIPNRESEVLHQSGDRVPNRGIEVNLENSTQTKTSQQSR